MASWHGHDVRRHAALAREHDGEMGSCSLLKRRSAARGPEIGVDRGRAVLRPPHMQLSGGEVDGPIASILGTVYKRKTACKMGLSRT
jgi:hypothetical protein